MKRPAYITIGFDIMIRGVAGLYRMIQLDCWVELIYSFSAITQITLSFHWDWPDIRFTSGDVNMREIIEALNKIVKSEDWYDFNLMSFDGKDVVIRGTLDESLGYNLEIFLRDVNFINAPMDWKVDTSNSEVVGIFHEGDFDEETRKIYFDKFQDPMIGFYAEFFNVQNWIYFMAKNISFNYKGEWGQWAWYDKKAPPKLAGDA